MQKKYVVTVINQIIQLDIAGKVSLAATMVQVGNKISGNFF